MHTVYLSGTPSGVQFTNNDITTGSFCGGVMVVIHEELDDLVVTNNRISTTSTDADCYGFQASGSAAAATFNRMLVKRNLVTTQGSTAVEISCCADCVASDNIVVGGGMNPSTVSSCNGGASSTRGTYQNNVFYNSTLSLANEGLSVTLTCTSLHDFCPETHDWWERQVSP